MPEELSFDWKSTGISRLQRLSLCNSKVRDFIASRHITTEQFLELDESQLRGLQMPKIRRAIAAGQIHIASYMALNSAQVYTIMDPEVIDLIINKHLTLDQLQHLNNEAAIALSNPKVRKFLLDEHIDIEIYRTFTSMQAKALRNKGVRSFINDKNMTLQQFLNLNDASAAGLENSHVREFIKAGNIDIANYSVMSEFDIQGLISAADVKFSINNHMQFSFAQLLELKPSVLEGLRKSEIREFICSEYVTVEQFLILEEHGIDGLLSSVIREFIMDGHIDFASYAALSTDHIAALRDRYVCDLVANGYITIEQFAGLNNDAVSGLKQDYIREFIINEYFDFNQYASFKHYHLSALRWTQVSTLISYGVVSVEHFLCLSESHVAGLELSDPISLIFDGHLTIVDYLNLSPTHARVLQDNSVCAFIRDGHINIANYMALLDFQVNGLRSIEVREFIIAGHMNITHLSRLHNVGVNCLIEHKAIRLFILANHISIDYYVQLPRPQTIALQYESIRQLIVSLGIFEQFALFDADTVRSLHLPLIHALIEGNLIELQQLPLFARFRYEFTREMFDDLRERRIGVDQLLRTLINAHDRDVRDRLVRAMHTNVQTDFNTPQSTHTTSVHSSVSESVTKLKQRYKAKLTPDNIFFILNDFIRYISNFIGPVVATYYGVARDCLPLAKESVAKTVKIEFTDPKSGVSLRELFALTYIAMQDEDLINIDINDIGKILVTGLYEINHGYALDSEEDTGQVNSSSQRICIAGTFNKIVETLAAWHPDCKVVFITGNTVTVKINAVIFERVATYVATSDDQIAKFVLSDVNKNLKIHWTDIWQVIQLEVKAEINEYFADNKDMVLGSTGTKVIDVINATCEIYADNSCLTDQNVSIVCAKIAKKQTVSTSKLLEDSNINTTQPYEDEEDAANSNAEHEHKRSRKRRRLTH